MKKKFVVILLLFGIVVSTSRAFADGEIIIQNEVHGSFYSVQKDNDNYVWKLGYKNSNSIIMENNQNASSLEEFRNVIDKISQINLEFYVSIAYLIIVSLFLLVCLIIKRRSIPKWFLLIMMILLIISTNAVVHKAIDLSVTQEKAKFIYFKLSR